MSKLTITILIPSCLFFSLTCHAESSQKTPYRDVVNQYNKIVTNQELIKIFGDQSRIYKEFLSKLKWQEFKARGSLSNRGEFIQIKADNQKASVEILNGKFFINRRPWQFNPWQSPLVGISEINKILQETKKTSMLENIFGDLLISTANANPLALLLGAYVYFTGGLTYYLSCSDKAEISVDFPSMKSSCSQSWWAWPLVGLKEQPKIVDIVCENSDSDGKFTLKADNGDELQVKHWNRTPEVDGRDHVIVIQHTSAKKEQESKILEYRITEGIPFALAGSGDGVGGYIGGGDLTWPA